MLGSASQQSREQEARNQADSGNNSNTLQVDEAFELYDEISDSPDVLRELNSVYNRTYWTENVDIRREQGMFIVRDPGTGALESVVADFRRTNRTIFLDPRFIPEGKQLVASVHSHPRNSRPTFKADYPAFKPFGSPKRTAWAIVLTQKRTYFVSPKQKTPGAVTFGTDRFLGRR